MLKTINRKYLLTLLTIIMAFNFLDFVALGIVSQSIKADLSLSDTELGLLSGIAFSLFYSVMGIPIARWADRGNRALIITLTTALWSGTVALCGFARSFLQFVAIRAGVAVGQAGCLPPALSLISDHYTRAELPRAVARYHLGWPLALLVGYFSAGWLNELYGWRVTYVVIGLPGIALAALAGLTVKEPRQLQRATANMSAADMSVRSSVPHPSLLEVFETLWGNTGYRHLLLAMSVSSFFSYGLLQWQPAFFMRTYGLRTGELGTWLAVIYGTGVGLGVYVGGELASRYAANNERLQLGVIAALYLVIGVLTAGVYLAHDYRFAFGLYAFAVFAGGAGNGPMFAATQTLVPTEMRAMSLALVNFFSYLIGMGLGSLAVGALSDALKPILGEESLRYALVGFCPGYIWVAWHLWKASRNVCVSTGALQTDCDIFMMHKSTTKGPGKPMRVERVR